MKKKAETLEMEINKWYKTKNGKYYVHIEKKERRNSCNPFECYNEEEIKFIGNINILKDGIIHSYKMEYDINGEAVDSRFDIEIKEIEEKHKIRETLKRL